MGIVARCTHLALNEQVAVKMLRQDVLLDQDATSRFMREAQAAVKLRSEYVARVSDVGTFENGVPYMVMEFLDGHDLGALLEEQHHIAVSWAVDLMLQTAEALAEAHSLNIVHRDVKPTNLFVTWRPDGSSLIKVLDFGISKSPMGTDMQLTQTQSLLGTPAYMSPEQMRSARLVDARSDIWSLGTVMYELIEGRRPFEAESFSEMCVKVAVDAPAPMTNAPPELEQVVLRCLAKSPEQRYPNMAELGRDLIPFARDPHQAAVLVERMTRMIGRSTPNWEGSGSGVSRTPVPGNIRDIKSGPVRAASPWVGGEPDTHREASTPALLPVDISKKSKAPLVVTLLVLAGAAAGAAFYFGRHTESNATVRNAATEPPVPMPVQPAPANAEPPEAKAPEVKPAEVKADEVTPDTAKTDDAAGSADIAKPKPPEPKVLNKRPKVTKVTKKVDKVDKKDEPPKEVKESVKPPEPPKTEPPPKKDLYDSAHPVPGR